MIALDKKTGINLKKGSSIRLEKDGMQLSNVCFGLNWGAIQKEGFLSSIFGPETISVDLDGAVTLFEGRHVSETIYFRNLHSINGSVQHSGDDLTGDLNGDDGLDNEVITIDLPGIPSKVDSIYIYLNSYQGQDFGEVPYSKIRIYEGSPDFVNEVLATFNLSVESKFKGYVSMIMGKLVRTPNNHWDFTAIGDPVRARSIEGIESVIASKYLNK